MTEQQKKLEKLLLQHIEDEIAISDVKDIPETALALVELWRATSLSES